MLVLPGASGYTAMGTVCNLAARLCAEAKDEQILISGRVAAAVEVAIPLEDLGGLALNGLSQPTLRVIEGGPPSDWTTAAVCFRMAFAR